MTKFELIRALNECSNILSYEDYTLMYNFINEKKSLQALYEIATGIDFEEMLNQDADEKAVSSLKYYFKHLVRCLEFSSSVEFWEEQTSGPRLQGFTIGNFTFITNYTGISGNSWGTICY